MQTATNPQTGEKVQWDGTSWQPVGGAPQQSAPQQPPAPTIYRTPAKAPTPMQVSADRRAAEAAARADRAESRSAQKDSLIIRKAEDELAGGDEAKAPEGDKKAGAFLIRALGANDSYEKTGVGPRSLVGQGLADTVPNALNYLPHAIGNSPERQVADSAQDEFIAASLRQDSGAAIPEEEMERQRRIYFPMPGDSAEAIEQKRQARLRAIEGLKQSSGRLLDESVERYEAMGQATPKEVQEQDLVGGQPRGTEVAFGIEGEGRGFDEELGLALLARRRGDTSFTVDDARQIYNVIGANPLSDEQLADVVKAVHSGDPIGAFDKNADEIARQKELQATASEMDRTQGEAGLANRAKQGATLGFMDEISGVTGGVINAVQGESFTEGYRDARDVQRIRDQGTDERTGLTGDVAEIAGSLVLPGGAIKSAGGAAKVGAGYGAAGGFGYGEGAENSIANAAFGTVLGGTVGAAAQKGGQMLANRGQNKAILGQKANDLATAGQAENVTVNRAMVDPALRNKVTGAQASMAGGPEIDRGLAKVSGEIEAGVDRLGAGGRPLDEIAGGNTVLSASERFIDKSGKAAKVKYDRAEKLAGDTKVAPTRSLGVVDDVIANLSETGKTNSAEIKFLQDLKEDFSKNLSVAALRRVRTSLRKKINKGDVVFGEDEATVLSIMDAAADDIRTGLINQGKPKAAKAFDLADKSYRARMEYITDTVQKVIGKRTANLSSEQVFKKFVSMSKNDNVGMRKFYATLTPEEAADVSATFAEQLGRNRRGDFTTAQFISQVEKMPEAARKTIFGPQGVESIDNLLLLAKEHDRLYSGLNHSRTGAAADYRGWLGNLFFGGAAGVALDGAVTGGVGVAAGAGAKLLRDKISAKMLMSPKITKWLKNAPKTSEPKAIDTHFNQLGKIAKAEPALASEIGVLQDFLIRAANDNPGRAATQERDNPER